MTTRPESVAGNRLLRLLLVEDSRDDADLLVREIRGHGFAVTTYRVDTAADLTREVAKREWDLVISDFSMPNFSGLDALRILKQSGKDLPFIMVSGTSGEETAVDALKAGAHDFLVKGRLSRLVPVIERELREAAMRRERALAQAAYRESELRYQRLIETANEGIWLTDRDDRTTYVNRRMAEMLGAHPEDLMGTSVTDYVDEATAMATRSRARRRRQGVPERYETKFRRKNGSEFWAFVSISPLFEPVGDLSGTLSMVTDISEQHALRAQLLVSDRMATLGTLAAGVAHEINNPLAAIISNLDLALDAMNASPGEPITPETFEQVREGVQDAREAAERVREIARDMKTLARAEDEKTTLVDLRTVLDSALRIATIEIRHRARLVKDYQDVPRVRANASRLGQVFINLLVNAAQSIAPGNAPSNEIRLSCRVEGDRVVGVVEDTGCGMTEEVKARIFSPFFTTKPAGSGTGLGLSICQRIVTSAGGTISVESTVGSGSCFRVEFPIAQTAAERLPAAVSAAPSASSERKQILVIDDEPLVLSVVKRTLERDHDVAVMASATDALDAIEHGRRYDVILCDLSMPRMTGMEFHSKLCQVAPAQAAQMIFFTGGASSPEERRFLELQKRWRLDKPFDAAALRTLVSARLRNSG